MTKILSFFLLISPFAFATPGYLINLNRWDLPWSIDKINVQKPGRSQIFLIDEMIPNTRGFDQAFVHLSNIRISVTNFNISRDENELSALAKELKQLLSLDLSTSENVAIGLQRLTLNQHIVKILKADLQFLDRPLWSVGQPNLAATFEAFARDEEARKSFFKILEVSSLDDLRQKIDTKFSDNKVCQDHLIGS